MKQTPSVSSNILGKIPTITVIICAVIAGLTGFMLGRSGSPAVSSPHPANERRSPSQSSPIPFVKRLPKSVDAPGVSERSESSTQEQKDLALEQRLTQRHIDKTAEKESRDYLPLFENLGLNPQQALELIEDLKRLHWGSARVNTSVIKLADARSEYDRKVKSMMGSESYEKYRAFESGKKASTEFEVMARYLGDRNQTLTSATAQNILAALEKHPAITTEMWHGPYDPVPRPLIGVEVIPRMEELIATINDSVPALLNELSQTLSQEELNNVHAYYTNRLSYFQHVRESALHPRDPAIVEQEDLERIRTIREGRSTLPR